MSSTRVGMLPPSAHVSAGQAPCSWLTHYDTIQAAIYSTPYAVMAEEEEKEEEAPVALTVCVPTALACLTLKSLFPAWS